jgi:dihydrolipoamide dehydrogenase
MASNTTQLAVIGAGPGGYAAAFLAADLGIDVTLIDIEEHPGGVCLYRGCIPSKALLHAAKVVSEAKEAAHWGIDFGEPKINAGKVQAWKNDIVKIQVGGLGQLSKARKINYVRGRATFADATTLNIAPADGGDSRLSFEHAIVATGSRPAMIPSLHIESPRVLDSTTALNLDEIPKSLLVIGGGYIGLELGSVYATLGSRVSVVEMMPSLLPGADKDLVRVLHKHVEPLFNSIMLNSTVKSMKEQKNGIKVTIETPDGTEDRVFSKVLVSVGRTPNSQNLGFEYTNVLVNERGFIEVDGARRTAEPSIFAIGDVVGEPMLAHKASHEGRTAVEVIAGHDVVFEPAVIPAVVFTDPEIAWCGLTEAEAKETGREVAVARFPWAASGRARTLGRDDGMTKLIIDPESERVLGMGIVGPGAGELIAEGALAIEMAAVASDLKLTIHPHPTLSETIMEAAEVFFGQATHVYRPKRR